MHWSTLLVLVTIFSNDEDLRSMVTVSTYKFAKAWCVPPDLKHSLRDHLLPFSSPP